MILSIFSGFYGFGGYDLSGTEAARVVFLIAADLFVVSLFARILFYSRSEGGEVKNENVEA